MSVTVSVRFAYVKFMTDNVKSCVPVSYIKHFDPVDETDFAKSRVYRVLWKNDGDDDDEGEYYKAQILLLGETEESLEKKIQCSRVKVAKVLDTSVEDSTDDESEQKMLKASRTERKLQKVSKAAAEKNCLDGVLQAKLTSKKKKPLCPEEVAGNEKTSVSFEEHDRAVKNALTYRQKYQQLKEEKTTLLEELDQYRTLNRELQKALVDQVSGVKTKVNTPNQQLDPVVEEKKSLNNLVIKDGEVDLGGGIIMKAAKWEHLQRITKPSIFAKSLAVAVWGSDTLMNRSIEGKVCPRFIKDGREAKPALTPQKYNAVKERYLQYLKTTGNVGKEEKMLNKYINEKISDINRAAAKRKLDA